jgi:Protein of unknown function (DUF2851)
VVGKPSSLPVRRQDGTHIPELVLGDRLDAALINNYGRIASTANAIPCAAFFPEIAPLVRTSWVQSLGAARMLERSAYIKAIWEAAKCDWQQAFWQVMLGAMGGAVNRQAFEDLAERVPFAVVAAQRKDPLALEAMLLYGAALLDGAVEDAHVLQLKERGGHFGRLYSITPLSKGVVRFGRMRPAGFPTLRLAQVAALLHNRADWLNLLEASLEELTSWLTSAPDPYWHTHYQLGKPTAAHSYTLGAAQVNHILINTLLPFAVFYHHTRGSEKGVEAALDRLSELKAEQNAVTRQYQQLGYRASSALESQGLIHLQRSYCGPKNCLSCGIGHQILKRDEA